MVRKLRNKFVIVTTTLMLTLFGGFLIINTIYTNYWNEFEIVEMLDWIAYSGIFTSHQIDVTSEEIIRDITKDESPIAGIILNQAGEILYTRLIGTDKEMSIPDDVLGRMYDNKNSKRKVGKYYYSYTKLNDDNVLLVVMNSGQDKLNGAKVLGIIALTVIGILLLIVITFWLSRFVTQPAEQTLLREKRFISDAGHELKTPLGAISINAQALEIENSDNIYIKNIISESERMGRLLEKLLVLARYDEQEMVNFGIINISDICEEMALTYESAFFEKKEKFEYEIIPDLKIVGNADEIRQLIAILIDNAIKNTEENGFVNLKCCAIKKHVEIMVINSGKGISKDILPHVFERFYTSDTSRTAGSFGLGLAIAKTIVERHKGNIEVESTPNEITTFHISF